MKEEIYNYLKKQSLENRVLDDFTASQVANHLRLHSEDVPQVYEYLNQLSEEKDEILKVHQKGEIDPYGRFGFRFAKEVYIRR